MVSESCVVIKHLLGANYNSGMVVGAGTQSSYMFMLISLFYSKILKSTDIPKIYSYG